MFRSKYLPQFWYILHKRCSHWSQHLESLILIFLHHLLLFLRLHLLLLFLLLLSPWGDEVSPVCEDHLSQVFFCPSEVPPTSSSPKQGKWQITTLCRSPFSTLAYYSLHNARLTKLVGIFLPAYSCDNLNLNLIFPFVSPGHDKR